MQAWVERNPPQPVPEMIAKAFALWSQCDTKLATAWISDQPPGPQYDTFARVMLEQPTISPETAAALVARIIDPTIRGPMLHRLKDAWQAADSEAATRWEKNLPAADHELLKY